MITNKKNNKLTNKCLTICFLLSLMLVQSCRSMSGASPTLDLHGSTQEPSFELPSPIPVTATVEILSTPLPPFAHHSGFKEYQDSSTGISINIPGSWTVTGIIDGLYAIFLSYPEKKYVGGEIFESGDTKCDLNIQTPGISAADLIGQWKSDSITTTLSEEEIILDSGQSGIRFELDSMGRSNSVITEINGRVVVLTCFGDFTQFDEIAVTLKAIE